MEREGVLIKAEVRLELGRYGRFIPRERQQHLIKEIKGAICRAFGYPFDAIHLEMYAEYQTLSLETDFDAFYAVGREDPVYQVPRERRVRTNLNTGEETELV